MSRPVRLESRAPTLGGQEQNLPLPQRDNLTRPTYPRTHPSKMTIAGYADASYSSTRSFSEKCFDFKQCLVTRKPREQRSVATSTTKAEYMALSEGARQIIWFNGAITELGVWKQGKFELLGDTMGAISFCKNIFFILVLNIFRFSITLFKKCANTR